jgi:hypothetical protein
MTMPVAAAFDRLLSAFKAPNKARGVSFVHWANVE